MKPAAIIFDLDGTLIDNNAYHIEAWKVFFKKIGRPWSDEEYKTQFNGKVNRDIFNYIFNRQLPAAELQEYTNEKEALYRELYAPDIVAIPGLLNFLNAMQDANIRMAIATSGIKVNIKFMFDHLPVQRYFEKVVDSDYVIKGKPDPEIFLTAASFVGAEPQYCIAFEDSVAGVRSAKAAGMKVAALTTTHTKEDLREADLVIKDYTEVDLASMMQLMDA
ncbi:MAG TPA: HAD family phosphatase [Panacibacter sp.]|nr:HAD family phosphatase [Panacibacter sp.]